MLHFIRVCGHSFMHGSLNVHPQYFCCHSIVDLLLCFGFIILLYDDFKALAVGHMPLYLTLEHFGIQTNS